MITHHPKNTMPILTLDNRPIFYFEYRVSLSRYPPLLLIHGAGGQHTNWPPPVRRLGPARAVAPDLPGHGRTAGPGCRSIEAYAAHLLAFMDALEIDSFIPVGHSMGGAAALQLALDAPERVAGLVVVNSGASLPVSAGLLALVREDFEAAVDYIVARAYGPAADDELKRLGRRMLAQAPPDVLLGDYLACDAFDVSARLAEVGAPALVVGAAADRMAPPEWSASLAERLPRADLHIVEDAGHMLPVEYPDKLAGLIRDWLEKEL
jgi:pimeloyl-ACP methyl ester carboxylesterase